MLVLILITAPLLLCLHGLDVVLLDLIVHVLREKDVWHRVVKLEDKANRESCVGSRVAGRMDAWWAVQAEGTWRSETAADGGHSEGWGPLDRGSVPNQVKSSQSSARWLLATVQ